MIASMIITTCTAFLPSAVHSWRYPRAAPFSEASAGGGSVSTAALHGSASVTAEVSRVIAPRTSLARDTEPWQGSTRAAAAELTCDYRLRRKTPRVRSMMHTRTMSTSLRVLAVTTSTDVTEVDAGNHDHGARGEAHQRCTPQ